MKMPNNAKQTNQSNTDIPQMRSRIALLKFENGKSALPLLWPITLPRKPTFASGFTATYYDKWQSTISHTLDAPTASLL